MNIIVNVTKNISENITTLPHSSLPSFYSEHTSYSYMHVSTWGLQLTDDVCVYVAT